MTVNRDTTVKAGGRRRGNNCNTKKMSHTVNTKSVSMFSNGCLELTLTGILLHRWFVVTLILTYPDDK